MDRVNSHTKSYNIPRSFEVMYVNIKYELRAWVTVCDETTLNLLQLCQRKSTVHIGFLTVHCHGIQKLIGACTYHTILCDVKQDVIDHGSTP